jgi:hypothetical protein
MVRKESDSRSIGLLRLKLPKLFLALFAGLNAISCWALKSDLSREQSGLTLGGGIYQHYLPNDNAFDPVPGLAPSGVTVTGSETLYIIPARMGYFSDRKVGGYAIYGRYIASTGSSWTASGDLEGTGSTRFGSIGIGAEATAFLLRGTRFRLGLTANSEYILQKMTLSFTPTGGTASPFNVSAESVLIGLGLKPEMYLGDLWTLSIFSGYQYGLSRTFEASAAGSFFGISHAAGTLTSPTTSSAIPSQQGGFLFEAILKLHFM